MSVSKKNIRWVQLSDFHVGLDEHGERMLFISMLDDIKKRVNAGIGPDMVFIAGDLAHSGTQQQYENFFQDFYMPLSDLLGSYWGVPSENRIFIVPGNHDIDQKKARAVKTHGVLKDVVTFLDPTEGGLIERSPLFPRLDAFMREDQTNPSGKKHWVSCKEGVLTKIININGQKIGILCINTAWLSSEKDDRHELSPGKPMLDSGLLAISDVDVRIVLGHHPIDWFIDEEVSPIRALFAKNRVIYLHGHLHKNVGRQEAGAGENFLVIQSGAAFQTREDDIWINGYLWCDLDAEEKNIYVEPFMWSRDNQEWIVDGTTFPKSRRITGTDTWLYPLPERMDSTLTASIDSIPIAPQTSRSIKSIRKSLPLGWQLITAEYLQEHCLPLSDEQVLTFFDGRVPSWPEAMSPLIPQRTIVKELVKKITHGEDTESIKITLLDGAGGEGKSTVLMQTICNIVGTDPKRHVLWHSGSGDNIPDPVALCEDNERWVVASDDADQIAKALFEVIKNYKVGTGPNVHFLLACRDTDWLATESSRLPWDQHASFSEVLLRGLTKDDAHIIIRGWRRLGKPGMGKLFDKSDEDAAKELFDAARSEYGHIEGAFLGAMLRLRIGDNLKSHVEKLLQRLNTIEGPNGNLMKVFAYIAAPHAENILSLTKMMLARILQCDIKDIKPLVVGPLGQEAAVSASSQFILTRHRAIAEVAVEIMSSKFGIDFDEIFIELAASVHALFREHVYIPKLNDWLFLSKHFLQKNRPMLAVRLSQSAYESNKDNAFLLVNYAKTLREVSCQLDAVRIFREASVSLFKDRTFYTEWGVAESQTDSDGIAVLLAGVCLSDNATTRPVDNNDASHGLSIIAASTLNLFRRYNNSIFRETCRAACLLGLSLPNLVGRAQEVFQERLRRIEVSEDSKWDVSISINIIKRGIMEAWKYRESELPAFIPEVTALTFISFEQLIDNMTRSKT